MEHKDIVKKFKALGLVTPDGQPVRFNAFKNRASIHHYVGSRGRKAAAKILFVGVPKDNLFGFYFDLMPDVDYMKMAYKAFTDTVAGNMDWHEEGSLVWGNCGIPIGYGKIRVYDKERKEYAD